MIVVMGLLVRALILSRIGCPQPGSLVSTTTTPLVATKTAVFPPPPFSTNRLSLTFSTSTTFAPPPPGGCCAAIAASESAPMPITALRTMCRVMGRRRNHTLRSPALSITDDVFYHFHVLLK